jgi:hypothetical protein
MRVSREVKISDDNYGNSTSRLEFTVSAARTFEVLQLLDEWERLLRTKNTALSTADPDSLTMRQMQSLAKWNKELKEVLAALEAVTHGAAEENEA